MHRIARRGRVVGFGQTEDATADINPITSPSAKVDRGEDDGRELAGIPAGFMKSAMLPSEMGAEKAEGLAEAGNVARIRIIDVPTLIVAGGNDPITPARMARRLHRISGASYRRLVVVEEGGHNGVYWTRSLGHIMSIQVEVMRRALGQRPER